MEFFDQGDCRDGKWNEIEFLFNEEGQSKCTEWQGNFLQVNHNYEGIMQAEKMREMQREGSDMQHDEGNSEGG